MIANKERIKNIASKVNAHPIHIKVFMSNFGRVNIEDVEEGYKKYVDENPRPFVKWAGGKRQLLQQFREMDLYPPDDFNPKTAIYFEPFVGGGAMFFDLLPKKAIISDMNLELVMTYNVIKNDVEKLIKKLQKHKSKNCKEYFLKVRAKKIEKLSDIEIAARFIYLNKTCFNGMYRVNRNGQFNVPYANTKNPLICDEDNLRKSHKALKNTKILHQNYKKSLQKAKRGDFIYFDPPYAPISPTSSFTSYTKDGFGEKEQIELRNLFYKLHKKGCFVMLSNSNSFFINKIYKELVKKDKKIKIIKVKANRMINSKASGRGEIKEVLVINY
ncbi:MAG: DNA adenine methylase [Patescibacteria group bacterium]|nr:DNA adenine methylase [Patescibacteria group bacterium]